MFGFGMRLAACGVTAFAVGLLACEREPAVALTRVSTHVLVRNWSSDPVPVRLEISGTIVLDEAVPGRAPEGPVAVGRTLRVAPDTIFVAAQVAGRTFQDTAPMPYAGEVWITVDVFPDSLVLAPQARAPRAAQPSSSAAAT